MTKKALFIFSILLSVTLFGQELKPIAKKVKTEETAEIFPKVQHLYGFFSNSKTITIF